MDVSIEILWTLYGKRRNGLWLLVFFVVNKLNTVPFILVPYNKIQSILWHLRYSSLIGLNARMFNRLGCLLLR